MTFSARARFRALPALVTLLVLGGAPGDLVAQDTTELDELTISTTPEKTPHFAMPGSLDLDPTSFRRLELNLDLPLGTSPDVTRWMRRVPGAAPISNGPISGQVQLRGMWGPRVDVRIDEMYVNSGGPNWMDPTLHYAPRGILEGLEVYRGLAPVRVGPETIGGAVRARTKQARRGVTEEARTRGSVAVSGHSVDDGFDGTFFAAQESKREWLHAFATHEQGDAYEFGRPGEVGSTFYDRSQWGVGYGVALGRGSLTLDARRQATDETGTPSLPMDIRYFDTDMLRLRYEDESGRGETMAQLWYTNVHHLMDNFTLRPAPNFFTPPPGASAMIQMAFAGTDERRNYANSDGLGLSLSRSLERGTAQVRVGGELHLGRHDTQVTDPRSRLLTTPFANIERDRLSAFAEWQGPLRGPWELEAGLRLTHVASNAGGGVRPGMPGGARLYDRFMAQDRDLSDTMVDFVAKLRRPTGEGRELEVGLGRKTRAPSYVERYAYLPTEATSGFADTNNTVGNLGLDPEVAYTLDLGYSIQRERAYLSPRLFYTTVDDYIQQTPTTDPTTVMVSRMNGDPTPLRFDNVDARYWGADAAFGHRMSDRWRLDGTVSYVRGRRRDIRDNLFRIAPLNGTLSLTHNRDRWSITAQGVFAAEQDAVSTTNSEPITPGWGTLNLVYQRQATEQVTWSVGVENVFDQYHRDHLAGFNRVLGSDVGSVARPTATANRIPGPGRNLFFRVGVTF